MPFFDRSHELESLEERWGSGPQLALLWGRRRIGKSALLRAFATGKPTVFYQAVKGTETEQLAGLTQRFLAHQADPVLEAAPLANWAQAIAYLLGQARAAQRSGETLLVVLDEFPYLVASNANLPSILQAAWEEVKTEDLPLFLVLAGSQIAMFERHVLRGPLYGRRTWSEQLPPLSYRDAAAFTPEWTAADRLRLWAIAGGVPYYLEQFEAKRSLAWNIEHRILEKGQVLYTEAELFIYEELGDEAATYLSIIGAVAGGATRQSEIAARAGVPPSAVPAYLASLRRQHVVEHIKPFGADDNARSGVWQLADSYLRFWFRFVRPNLTDLEARLTGEVLRDRVLPNLDEFVSMPAFEDACREHVRASIGHDPEFPARGTVSAWWGQIPDGSEPGTRRTRRAEIEIVVHDGRRLELAAEVKWRDVVDTDALRQLEAAVIHAPGYHQGVRLVIYGRGGFTPQLRTEAAAKGVLLRTVEDLFS